MKIRDLVTVDEKAEFRNDVQLSDFDDPEVNLALLQSYLFTHMAPAEQESTVGLLRTVIAALSAGRLENRMAVVANYGHGKSHLALVLANYFSKPYQSPEFGVILDKLSRAIDSEAQMARYRDYKENRGEHLVIRLRGDVPHTLREQFVAGLEQALREHTATKKERVPHWYEGAEKFLSGLKGDHLAKANRYLGQFSTEVKLLLADVRGRRDSAYEQVRGLSQELYGFPLEFGAQVSMAELLKWATDKFCGEGRPLGGVLVLFDEFSLYVMSYAQRNAAGELQDLLNGFENNKGSAVFLAFAQHDPVALARHLAHTVQGESLEKELTRIPKRVALYSLMESVVDSYLTQPEAAWLKFRQERALRGPLTRASNMTLEVFGRRYDRTLNWDVEKFDEIVTKGCFPLHPTTTALLCDMQLQAMDAAGNPRTVLGFVLEQIKEKQNEPATLDGRRINWVLPVALADYFREYLPDQARRLFDEARRHLPGDAPEEQVALLKAMLLQEAARLPVRRDTQSEFLAEASGLELDEARRHLRALSDNNIIRWDSGTKLYSFWPLAINPHRLDELVKPRLKRASSPRPKRAKPWGVVANKSPSGNEVG